MCVRKGDGEERREKEEREKGRECVSERHKSVFFLCILKSPPPTNTHTLTSLAQSRPVSVLPLSRSINAIMCSTTVTLRSVSADTSLSVRLRRRKEKEQSSKVKKGGYFFEGRREEKRRCHSLCLILNREGFDRFNINLA